MSKEQALTAAVRHYIATMPVGLLLDMVFGDMMMHFMHEADDDEVEEFLLEFGPDNTPKGAH